MIAAMRWFAIAALAGCGGASATGSGSGGPCLPIAPMRLLVLEHGAEWEPTIELRADGSLVRDNGVVGRIEADQVYGKDGRLKMTCAGRSISVGSGGQGVKATFDGDALVDADGSRLFVDDQGGVHWMRGGKDILGEARFDGRWRPARRTAAIVVLVTLF